jgi:hypothetical protein
MKRSDVKKLTNMTNKTIGGLKELELMVSKLDNEGEFLDKSAPPINSKEKLDTNKSPNIVVN